MFLGCLGVDAVGDTAGTEVPNCGSDALVLGSEGAFTHETIDFEFEWGNDVGVVGCSALFRAIVSHGEVRWLQVRHRNITNTMVYSLKCVGCRYVIVTLPIPWYCLKCVG